MKIITICGSLKFEQEMKYYAERLELEGNCVLSIIYYTKRKEDYTNDEISFLQMAHLKRIEMSDAIFVVNKNGYIGEAVKREISHAKKYKKEIIYLEKIEHENDKKHTAKKISLEALDERNWLKICDLSVSNGQKPLFPISNVYWIGISRYEEKTELFAIKTDNEYVGLIGGGFDEDNITGYINPIMIDCRFQRNGYAKSALLLMIEYLHKNLGVNKININHRKENKEAGKIYETLGFFVYTEDKNEYKRQLDVLKMIS
jgi:RimJ/RimL family protein N-acetyltransferase